MLLLSASLGLFLYFNGRYPDMRGNAKYPFLVLDNSYIGGENEWHLQSFQPVVVDIYERKGDLYMVGQYSDFYGEKREVEILVIDPDYKKYVYYYEGSEKIEKLSIEQFKKKVEIGKQIKLDFFQSFPTKDTLEQNSDLCKYNNELCVMKRTEGGFDGFWGTYGEFQMFRFTFELDSE